MYKRVVLKLSGEALAGNTDKNFDNETIFGIIDQIKDCLLYTSCISKALGDKAGIKRFGQAIVPMDEALVLCAIDFSGRAYLNFDAHFTVPALGLFDLEMVEEFFRAVADNAGMTLHIKVLDGKNNHHIAEGIFKAFGRAMDMATSIDERIDGVLSTKGMLE